MMKERSIDFLVSFLVCTACIGILEGVVGVIFLPEETFGYEAFFSPPLFGFFSILFGFVTKSKRELRTGEAIGRQILHLLFIECLVFGLNYASGVRFETSLNITLALTIALIFVVVNLIMFVNDRRNALLFNEELKKFQEKERKREV